MAVDILLQTLQTTLSKTKVNQLSQIASTADFSIKALIDLTFYPEEQVAFRAAWILENVYINYTARFMPEAVYFLQKFTAQNNFSCRRHYGKILALMTNKKATIELKQIISSYPTDDLVDTVFGWLIDENVPVAVKSHCLNILANLYVKHDWIKDELLQTIDFLIDKESIAFYAKAKQIRKQLKV